MFDEDAMPPDFRVDIRDPRIADDITPAGMQAYLEAHGWQMRHDEAGKWQQWTEPGTGADIRIPLSTRFGDYRQRVRDLILCLEEVEDRSQLAVWADLRAARQTAT